MTTSAAGRRTRSAAELEPKKGQRGTTQRLSINLSPEIASMLRELAVERGLTITEAVRRAIAIYKFAEEEIGKGNRLAIVEHADGRERVREIVLVG